MTDSGAYQLLEYGKIDIDNATIINYEKKIDSDIAVILDYPTGDSLDRSFARQTIDITLTRAREALDLVDFENRAWVLPIQGGIHLDLLDESAEASARLDYDIYALGSPTKMMESYNYEVVADMIVTVKKRIPFSKPLHLFGGGHPMLIPFSVALGADLFDSASYMLFARDDRYMTEKGTKRLEDLEFFPCNCSICSKFSPEDVKEMERTERTKLLAKHNLSVISSVLRKTKQAIVEGRLWELLEEFSKGHPSLYSLLFHVSKKHYVYLEYHTPSIPSKPGSVFVYDRVSLSNPYLSRSYKFIIQKYIPPRDKEILLLKPRMNLTITDENIFLKREEHLVYYDHLLTVPIDMTRLHPEGHIVTPRVFVRDETLYMQALRNAVDYAMRKKNFYKKIILYVCYEFLEPSLRFLREYQFMDVKPIFCS